jgi:hypothetical protein
MQNSDSNHPGYRIFILGAGFSKAAGLPLGEELYREVHYRIESELGMDTYFHRDLKYYKYFRKLCDGIELKENEIDFEELISYLDIEHYLGLKGSDTWSRDGNRTQVLIKNCIGQIIQERTPASDNLPNEYYEFAHSLTPNDIVITFNYDIVLERALDHIRKPYRLFPERYKKVDDSSAIIDDTRKELVIRKMHGSVDWFSNEQFKKNANCWKKRGSKDIPNHPIFKDPITYLPKPIVDGPRFKNDPFIHIHRIGRPDDYYRSYDVNNLESPFILSPSYEKIVYTTPFLDLWYGFGIQGGNYLGLSIIGFSLPKQDKYVKMGLFQMADNYQNAWWDYKLGNVIKDKIKLVDYQNDENDRKDYIKRFGFVNNEKTEMFFDGFCSEAVRFLFTNIRSD